MLLQSRNDQLLMSQPNVLADFLLLCKTHIDLLSKALVFGEIVFIELVRHPCTRVRWIALRDLYFL